MKTTFEPRPKNLILFHKTKQKNRSVLCKGIISEFNPDYFGINYYFNFENLADGTITLPEEEEERLEDANIDLYNLAQGEEVDIQEFNDLKLLDEADILVTYDRLGEAVVCDDAGSICCTVDEFDSNNGVFDIDGEYDSYYWKTIDDLSEYEFELLFKDLSFYEFEHLLDANQTDILNFIKKETGETSLVDTKDLWYLWESKSFAEFAKIEQLISKKQLGEEDYTDDFFLYKGLYYKIREE